MERHEDTPEHRPADADAFVELLLTRNKHYGIVFYDLGLRITGWSGAAEFITGWRTDEVLGQPIAILFIPEDRERMIPEHEADMARTVGAGEDERWHVRKDGSLFWSSGVSLPLHRGGRLAGYVKIFRDVTHLRARLKYLENVQEECAALQKRRDTRFGAIVHEMRDPLAPLHNGLQVLKRTELPPLQAGMVALMERQLGGLQRLVEDLVDLTRVQSGKMRIVHERLELQPLLREALDDVGGRAREKRLTVQSVVPEVPISLDADGQRLKQVVINLLGNAIKYTPPGGRVWLTASADRTHAFVYVKDDGDGIAPELLPRIFDMFTQADGAPSDRGAGLGVGLAVVKELVSLHRGTVEVRSEGPGKGSEFIVRVPLHQPVPEQGEAAPEPAA